MKLLSIITAVFILVFGTVASRGADLARISDETGVPIATLQAERASTGLGWGELEKAHLLANASGRSFDEIVALHKGGEGWGQIAHDNGLNLGKVVSNARHEGSGFIKGSPDMHGMNGIGHSMGGMGHGMGKMGHSGHGGK
jgi:hypothetical protein